MKTLKPLLLASAAVMFAVLPAMAQNENRNSVPDGKKAVDTLSRTNTGNPDTTMQGKVPENSAPASGIGK